jgi:hypothetical protein
MKAVAAIIRSGRVVLERLCESAAFSYITIGLLQLKVIWGIWQFRDLTFGDTSSYFVNAYGWYERWSNSIAWSPLYTAFYGSFLYFSRDAYVVTTAHRAVIVLLLALLILAMMRRLLPPPLAWFITAWWVGLPINFNALYEVHLFAVIPVVIAYLAILGKTSCWRRGAAIGILFASSLLVRNELIVAAILLGGMALAWEVVKGAKRVNALPHRRREYLLAYGVPLVLAGLLTLLFYSGAHLKFPGLWSGLKAKHTMNACQVYAFGYKQRNPDWQKSPWTQCRELMLETFGKADISMAEALLKNPRPILEHFRWNLSLVPNGVQVLLFNATSGKTNPDYPPVNSGSRIALVLSVIVLGIWVAGAFKIYREWNLWWANWFKDRAWGWLAMGCVSSVVAVAMLTQRPRPSYMFGLGLLIMAATGTGIYAIVRTSRKLERLAKWFPMVAVCAIILMPSYYMHWMRDKPRPLLEAYRRLTPFRDVIGQRETVFLTPGYGSELCHYLTTGRGQVCTGVNYHHLRGAGGATRSWGELFERHGINLFYADKTIVPEGRLDQFIKSLEVLNWEVLATQNYDRHAWALFKKGHPREERVSDRSLSSARGETEAARRWISSDSIITVLLIAGTLATLVICGLGLTLLLLPENFRKFTILLAPITGVAALIVASQTLGMLWIPTRWSVYPVVLLTLGLLALAIRRRGIGWIRGLEWRPWIVAALLGVLTGWPLVMVGYRSFLAFNQADTVRMAILVRHLQRHSYWNPPPPALDADFPFARSIRTTVAVTHWRMGVRYLLASLADLFRLDPSDLFGVLNLTLFLLLPTSVFLLCHMGFGLGRRVSLLAAAIHGFSAYMALGFFEQKIQHITAMVLLPVALAWIYLATTQGISRGPAVLGGLISGAIVLGYPEIVAAPLVGVVAFVVIYAWRNRATIKDRSVGLLWLVIVTLVCVNPLNLYFHIGYLQRQTELLIKVHHHVLTLSRAFIPVFWGLADRVPLESSNTGRSLVQLGFSADNAAQLLIGLGALFSVMAIVGLVALAGRTNVFTIAISLPFVVQGIVVYMIHSPYGMGKNAHYSHFLAAIGMASGVVYIWRRVEGWDAFKAVRLPVAGIALSYFLLNATQIYNLADQSLRETHSADWADLKSIAGVVPPGDCVLIGLTDMQALWAAYYLEGLRVGAPLMTDNLPPFLASVPATQLQCNYLLVWRKGRDIIDYGSATPIWANDTFSLIGTHQVLVLGNGWERPRLFGNAWQRISRPEPRFYVLNSVASSAYRLKLSATPVGPTAQVPRRLELFINGEPFEDLLLQGAKSILTRPFIPRAQSDEPSITERWPDNKLKKVRHLSYNLDTISLRISPMNGQTSQGDAELQTAFSHVSLERSDDRRATQRHASRRLGRAERRVASEGVHSIPQAM